MTGDGFELIRLHNSCLSVSVLPQLGGKIFELTDLRSGRDWLWKNPHIDLRHPDPGMDYDLELDSGGWDEVLFSVKPCTMNLPDGRQIPIGDHGPLVGMPWTLVECSINESGKAVLELQASGDQPSFELRRRMTLHEDEARIEFEYTLSNRDETPWPWMWYAHPLIAIEKDMQIHVSNGQQIRCEAVNGNQVWPVLSQDDGTQIDLARIFERVTGPESYCEKVFVRSLRSAGVSTGTGEESISIEYDERELPWLGLWINKRAWSGCDSAPYLNLGLEPGTAPYDFLTNAVSNGAAKTLDPGESRSWALVVNLKTNKGLT